MTPPLPSISATAVVARLLAGKATFCKAVARQRQHRRRRAHRRQPPQLQLRLRPREHQRQPPQLRLRRRERRRQRRQLRSRQQLRPRQLRRRHRRLLTRPDIRPRPGRSRRVVRRCSAKWTSYSRELARDASRVPSLSPKVVCPLTPDKLQSRRLALL